GDSRPGAKPPIKSRLVPTESLHIFVGQRPWTDDAHFPPTDIHELRQLVQARSPQPATDARHLPITHTAKLEYLERTSLASQAGRHKECRPAVLDDGRQCDRGCNRREYEAGGTSRQ